MAEGAPYMPRPVGGFDLLQQRRSARAHDLAQILFGVGLEKEAVIRRLALPIGIEPRPLAGDMVEHQIRHQGEFIRDPVDIGPIAQLRVHPLKI